jgi:hypothetical protein
MDHHDGLRALTFDVDVNAIHLEACRAAGWVHALDAIDKKGPKLNRSFGPNTG